MLESWLVSFIARLIKVAPEQRHHDLTIDDVSEAQCDDEILSFVWLYVVASQARYHLRQSTAVALHIRNAMLLG